MTKKTDRLLALLAFLFPMGVYHYTLARTVVWGDSADLALRVYDFILDPAADGHPLFIVLGRFFNYILPWGDLAVNLNYMCAIFAALAVLFVYLTLRRITGGILPALAGAVALTVSHSLWLHAVITEVYTLNAFFIAFLIWLLVRWRETPENTSLLYCGAFVFGLSLTNHMLIGLFGIAVLFILATYRPKIFLDGKKFSLMLLCFGIGALLYWGTLLYWTVTLPPVATEAMADIVTGRAEHRAGMLSFGALAHNILYYLAYLFYQFPVFGFFLGFIGFYALFQNDKRLFGFLFLAIFSNAFFTLAGVSTFGNANYTFYISDYVVFSIAIGCGLERFVSFMRQSRWREYSSGIWVIILLYITPVAMYNIVPWLTKKLDVRLIYCRSLPFRDDTAYFLNPSKRGYLGPALYADSALRRAKRPGSIIIADFTPGAVLEYFTRIKRLRPDVKVVYTSDAGVAPDYDLLAFVEKNIDGQSIYLADLAENCYNVESLLKDYTIMPREPIWEIRPKVYPAD